MTAQASQTDPTEKDFLVKEYRRLYNHVDICIWFFTDTLTITPSSCRTSHSSFFSYKNTILYPTSFLAPSLVFTCQRPAPLLSLESYTMPATSAAAPSDTSRRLAQRPLPELTQTAQPKNEALVLAMASEGCQIVRELPDLALAILLSLIAGEHALIRIPQMDSVDHPLQFQVAEKELYSVCEHVFNIRPRVLQISPILTTSQFVDTLLGFSSSADPTAFQPSPQETTKELPNVFILSRVDSASAALQSMLADLILQRQVHSTGHTGIFKHLMPFIFIATISDTSGVGTDTTRPKTWLQPYFADLFCLSHAHSPDTVMGSHSGLGHGELSALPRFQPSHITALAVFSNQFTNFSDEIRLYIQDLILFLRLHPALAVERPTEVASAGVSPLATRLFLKLTLALAAVHGLTYIPPTLVGLAFAKVYTHRLSVPSVRDAWQNQATSWQKVGCMLMEWSSAQDVIQDVLEKVKVPL